jgi:N-acetylmuramoyl-L-alanine amidase
LDAIAVFYRPGYDRRKFIANLHNRIDQPRATGIIEQMFRTPSPSLLVRTATVLALLLPISTQAATVAIDIGHSLNKPGALSARGRDEFQFNRDLSLQVADALLARGIAVRLINADGNINRLTDRPRKARGVDLFLSVHHDSMQAHFLASWDRDGTETPYGDRYAGHSLFVSRENPRLKQSLACASAIGKQMRDAGFSPTTHHAEKIPGENRPFADEPNGVHYFDHLAVLRHAHMPGVLFEAGVIVNREEELLLLEPERQARMAQAIATGIEVCLQN